MIPPWVWLVIAAVMAVAEVTSVSLITVWFVIGGLAAFAADMLGMPVWAQLVIFIVVSVACLVLIRPIAMKYRKQGSNNEHSPVGGTGIVTEAIDASGLTGRVELSDHVSWSARSADGQPIEVGAHVRVVRTESIKLIVERV